MNLTNPRRTELQGMPYLNNALDLMSARVNQVFSEEHTPDGEHTDITGTSVTVTGDVTGDSGIFTGDVIALNGTGTECGIGTLSTVDGESLLPGQFIRQGLLIGGVADGFFVEWRLAQSPFPSGREVAFWNLDLSTNRPMFRIGVFSGVPTLIDGGSGASFALGDISDPLASLVVTDLVTTGLHREQGVITPTTLTGDVTDYEPTGLSTTRHIRIASDASPRSINSIAAQPDGTVLTWWNVGLNTITFPHGGAGVVTNRIVCPGAVTFTLNVGGAVEMRYDGTSGLWRLKEN